jgi:hypothetical protein
VIALVIVTEPKPPGSRTLIVPPASVALIAPANVLQGAVRVQEMLALASSPTPETHVCVAAWAPAGKASAARTTAREVPRCEKIRRP